MSDHAAQIIANAIGGVGISIIAAAFLRAVFNK